MVIDDKGREIVYKNSEKITKGEKLHKDNEKITKRENFDIRGEI